MTNKWPWYRPCAPVSTPLRNANWKGDSVRGSPSAHGCARHSPRSVYSTWIIHRSSSFSEYLGGNGKKYHVNEVLRYQGGYLYRVVTRIRESESGEDVEHAMVRPRTGPNRTVPFSLTKGIRLRFTDRTYVVLSIVTGLPLGLEPEALKTASERDARQLIKLLDNPSDASLGERIGPEVDAIAASLKSLLEQRRIAAERHGVLVVIPPSGHIATGVLDRFIQPA